MNQGWSWFEGVGWSVILVEGVDGLDLLQRLTTNDVVGLAAGECRATLLTTEKGRIIDLLYAVPLKDGRLFLLGSPRRGKSVVEWLEKFTILEDVKYYDLSDNISVSCAIADQTNSGDSILDDLELGSGRSVEFDAPEFHAVAFRPAKLPYGLAFFARLVPAADRSGDVEMRGRGDSIPLARGREEFEHERIAAGIPLAPGELSERWTPYDVGLQQAISLKKGCYVGQEVLARMETYQKIRRGFVRLIMETYPENESSRVLMKEGNEIGYVTSVSPRRSEGGYIALGVARVGGIERGEVLQSGSRGGTRVVSVLDREGIRWE